MPKKKLTIKGKLKRITSRRTNQRFMETTTKRLKTSRSQEIAQHGHLSLGGEGSYSGELEEY